MKVKTEEKMTDRQGMSMSERLVKACKEGDAQGRVALYVVLALLERGALTNAIDLPTKRTPLLFACSNGLTEVAVALLNHGADIHAVDKDKNTPLHLACKGGNNVLVSILLERGADVNARGFKQETPMHLAINDIRTVLILWEHGADVDASNVYLQSPLYFACSRGCLDVALFLSEEGACIHGRTFNGSTPLHSACDNGHTDVAVSLVDRGACINSRDDNQRTPLHIAVRKGRSELAYAMLNMGADPNTVDSFGVSPTTWMYLVRYWINIPLTFSRLWGMTPLLEALFSNNIENFRELLDQRSSLPWQQFAWDPNQNIGDGWTLMHAAAYLNRSEILNELLKCERVDVSARSTLHHTALHVAANRGHLEVLVLITSLFSDQNL